MINNRGYLFSLDFLFKLISIKGSGIVLQNPHTFIGFWHRYLNHLNLHNDSTKKLVWHLPQSSFCQLSAPCDVDRGLA